MASTDITDSNDLAVMDASAIGHHGKEDGSCQKEEAEHPQHNPIQGMRKDLENTLKKIFVNRKQHLPLLQFSFCLMSILCPISLLHQDLVASHPLDHLLCDLIGEESNVGQDPVMRKHIN